MSHAQLDTSGLWVNVDSILITSTRITNNWTETTQSLSDKDLTDKKEFLHQYSLEESLNHIPGVFSLNNTNAAQDLRVSIRGFGSRSNFGVRGIKFIIDGIPESTPDGQTQLDAVPLGLLRNVEVIKGPSSVLYGNASGGVISLNTLSEYNHNLLKGPLLETRISYGSYNTSQLQLTYGHKQGKTSYVFHANQLASDGYRGHSAFVNRNLKIRTDHTFSKFSKINLMVDFLSSPKAEDPGALTLEEVDVARSAARTRNVEFQTGESINNLKTSVNYELKAAPNRTLNLYGFYVSRKFDGKLPFQTGGIVDLNRNYFGQGATYTINTYKQNYNATFTYGYDLANQLDNRIRYSNLNGEKGAVDVMQAESFKSAGLYILSRFDLGQLKLNGGLRYDYNDIGLRDDLFFGQDDSGTKTFAKFSHSLGVSYSIDASTGLYLNYATGFETPSLVELLNNPASINGFNETLEPQQSKNIELGVKFELSEKINAQVALFKVNTDGELIPFQLDTFPDRTFFRNAGTTVRTGLELEGTYQLTPELSGALSLTFASYKFDEFSIAGNDLSGNVLPGLPASQASFSVQYKSPFGLNVRTENSYIGKLYLQNENASTVDSYFLSNLYLNYSYLWKNVDVRPFLGLKNIFNTSYFDNIRINASNSRYYEPAPGFNVFGGIKIRV